MNNHPLDGDFNPDKEHPFSSLAADLCVCLRMKSHPIHGVWKVNLSPPKPRKAPGEPYTLSDAYKDNLKILLR